MSLNFLKKLFTRPENKILLGRWSRTGDEIKSLYANHDHCGGIICRNPTILTNHIRKKTEKKDEKKR